MGASNSMHKNKYDKKAEGSRKIGEDGDSENSLRLIIFRIYFKNRSALAKFLPTTAIAQFELIFDYSTI